MRLRLAMLLTALGACGLWAQKNPGDKQAWPDRRSPGAEAGIEKAGPAPAVSANAAPASSLDADLPAFTEYQLGPEDLISVTVLDAAEFSRHVRVGADGTIKLPLMKHSIPAVGKTTGALEQDVARALIDEGLLREPSVSVMVHEFHSKPVSVSGAVRSPTVIQAARPLSIVEAIARAGGLADNAGSEIQILTPERDGKPPAITRVSTKVLTDLSEIKPSIWLRGGEEVRVSSAGRVYMLGGVSRPGAILINTEEPLTILRALAMSGGVTPGTGSKAYLLRSSDPGAEKKEIALNLRRVMKRQDPDMPLQANDVVFVPESKSKKTTQAGMSAVMQSLAYALVGAIVWR